MGSWVIRWRFNKESYNPGETASASFWLENTGDTHLYLSELKLEFDFGTHNLENISGMIRPRENKLLGNVHLSLPESIVGRRIFRIKYHMYEYADNNWIDLGYYYSDKWYFIGVYPKPFYRVFVSRGLREEDRSIGDPIAEMIREWGFETVTVGIEVEVPDEQVPARVREEIRKADALIAIATPRHRDDLTGLWKTLEWLHNEVGIAFGIDKPLLILKDKRVSLGGLPLYLANLEAVPIIEFDPYNLDELRIVLSTLMPEFREWIETKRRQKSFDALGRVIVGGLAIVGLIAIVSGIVGVLRGTSKI